MKKVLTVLSTAIVLAACNTQPTYYQPTPTVAVAPQATTSADDYVVLNDAYGNPQYVVVNNSGAQMLLAYATFMNLYNAGGYGSVLDYYRTNPTYFRPYAPNNYRNYRSTHWYGTYSYGSNYKYRNYQNSRPAIVTRPATTLGGGNTFRTPTTLGGGNNVRVQTTVAPRTTLGGGSTNTYSRPQTSLGGGSLFNRAPLSQPRTSISTPSVSRPTTTLGGGSSLSRPSMSVSRPSTSLGGGRRH